MAETSMGLRLSYGTLRDGTVHYAVSQASCPMGYEEADSLGRLLSLLRHNGSPHRTLPGPGGIFHVLIR